MIFVTSRDDPEAVDKGQSSLSAYWGRLDTPRFIETTRYAIHLTQENSARGTNLKREG